jgi:hypothetical protein
MLTFDRSCVLERGGHCCEGYKQNGTTTLFAALNMLDGTVIGPMDATAQAPRRSNLKSDQTSAMMCYRR